ncbi:hypothetical protein D3C72_1180190 [compost metagenome]
MAADHVEMPVRHAVDVRARIVVEQAAIVATENFGRHDAFEFLLQAYGHGAAVAGKLHQFQGAAGQRQPGQASRHRLALRDAAHGQQRALGLLRQQVRIRQGAGRDHAHDLAFNGALAGGRVTDLFANGHRLAQLDQLGQIAVERMKRHAAHLDRVATGHAARRQGNAQQARGFFRILEKQFVEIAHAVEDQHRRVVLLDA